MTVLDRIPFADEARGRWRGILSSLGVTERALSGKHGPCPICAGGRDRFRFDDKEGRGTWICSHCGAGDGVILVQQLQGVDFKGALALIRPMLGIVPVQAVRQGPTEEDCRRWRNEAWRAAEPVQADNPVGRYLLARVGVLQAFPRSLRYHPSLEHRDEDGVRSRHPAMLAMISGPDGKPVNLHRTWLTLDGRKADVAKPRMLMPTAVSAPEGSAVRLTDVAEELGIAEGIETAFAATAIYGIPVWSAISAGVLAKWKPPTGVKRVVVFGDSDVKFAGQHAAYQLANRLAVRERIVVEVRMPDVMGLDWNDVLRTTRTLEIA